VASAAADRRTSKGRKHSFTSAIRSARGNAGREKGVGAGSDEGRFKGVVEERGTRVEDGRAGERRNKNTHGASRRAIGRALPCRRIITCTLRAPWQRGVVGTLCVRSAYLAPPPGAGSVGMDFFSAPTLESGATPNFVRPPRSPSFASSFFREIGGDLSGRPFVAGFSPSFPPRDAAGASGMRAATTTTHVRPLETHEGMKPPLLRPDGSEGRVSAGDFRALETSTLSSLSVDIVAILSGVNTYVGANELDCAP